MPTRGAKLYRRGADAAGTAMDQYVLAGFQPRGVHQVCPDCEMHLWQRGGIGYINIFRHWQYAFR